jgi:hypothetical protein
MRLSKGLVSNNPHNHNKKRAIERGFRSKQEPRNPERYIEDGARSGRPKQISFEVEQQMLINVKAVCLYEKAEQEVSTGTVIGAHSPPKAHSRQSCGPYAQHQAQNGENTDDEVYEDVQSEAE